MRFSIAKILVVGLVCLFTAVSCKDSSTDSSDNDSVNGLWKLNSTEGDVAYVNLTNTTVTFYDYMGDDFDQEEDCYDIESEEIVEIDGDIYHFDDPENPGETVEVEITVENNTLTVKQSFNNNVETIKFSRYSGNTNSFTPECTEEVTAAKSTFGISR